MRFVTQGFKSVFFSWAAPIQRDHFSKLRRNVRVICRLRYADWARTKFI